MILTPGQVLAKGFKAHVGLPNDHDGTLNEKDINKFKKVHGSSPAVVAFVWSDLMTAEEEAFQDIDRSEKGFKRFLIATHFAWAYPKNADLLALAFGVSLRQV